MERKDKEQRFDEFLEKVNKNETNFIELEKKVNEVIGVVNYMTTQLKANNEFTKSLYDALNMLNLIEHDNLDDNTVKPTDKPEPIPEDFEPEPEPEP